MKETWIFNKRKNKFIKATKWLLFKHRLIHWFTKWKLVNRDNYCLVPWEDSKKQFMLSDKEYKDAQKIYKNKGTISYEFYPCAGLAWGVKVHVNKTGETIDITDVSTW